MTQVWIILALAAAGGLGAASRFVVDTVITVRLRPRFPLGTQVINLTGSLALGILTGVAVARGLPDPWTLILGVGLLGGYTTFSTASYETVRLAQHGRWGAALWNGLGMLVATALCAAAGLWTGASLAA